MAAYREGSPPALPVTIPRHMLFMVFAGDRHFRDPTVIMLHCGILHGGTPGFAPQVRCTKRPSGCQLRPGRNECISIARDGRAPVSAVAVERELRHEVVRVAAGDDRKARRLPRTESPSRQRQEQLQLGGVAVAGTLLRESETLQAAKRFPGRDRGATESVMRSDGASRICSLQCSSRVLRAENEIRSLVRHHDHRRVAPRRSVSCGRAPWTGGYFEPMMVW